MSRLWFGGNGAFQAANDWIAPGAPVTGDFLEIRSGRSTLAGASFGAPTAGSIVDLDGGSGSHAPVFAISNVTLTEVSLGTFTLPGAAPGARPQSHYGAVTMSGEVRLQSSLLLVAGPGPAASTLTVKLQGHANVLSTGTVRADTGGRMAIQGSGQSTLTNMGQINAFDGASITIGPALMGSGVTTVGLPGHAAKIELKSAVGPEQIVEINAGTLQLDKPHQFAGFLDILGGPSTVRLSGVSAASWDEHDGLFELRNAAGDVTTILHLVPPGDDSHAISVYNETDSKGHRFVGIVAGPPPSHPPGGLVAFHPGAA